MKALLRGLSHCHSLGIAHRDVKPGNLMYAEKNGGDLKLIDFGFANAAKSDKEKFSEILGSPLYMAPEIVKGLPYTTKCDIYSAGIMLYFMLVGELPYKISDSNVETLFEYIKCANFTKESFSEDNWKCVSEEAKDMLCHMLAASPEKRATAENLLKHKWLEQAKDTPIAREELQKAFGSMKEILVNFAFQFLQKKVSQFQHAVLSFLVYHSTVQEETKRLQAVFSSMDKDQNQMISKEELKKCIIKYIY